MTASDNAVSGSGEGLVGIFWLYKHRLMASPIPLERAEPRGTKLDSPEAHVRLWPRMVARHKAEFPILDVLEYDEVPRGRVIFDTAAQTFIVYMDETLFADAQPARGPRAAVWDALRAAFQLDGRHVRFATDPHYRIPSWDDEDADTDPF